MLGGATGSNKFRDESLADSVCRCLDSDTTAADFGAADDGAVAIVGVKAFVFVLFSLGESFPALTFECGELAPDLTNDLDKMLVRREHGV